MVIGDEFEDRLSCWNAGLLFQASAESNQVYKTLRAPKSILGDAFNRLSIAKFLKKFNSLGSNNGPAKIYVRSSSVSADNLEEFISILKKVTQSNIEFERINSLDDCTPMITSLVSSETINRKVETKSNKESVSIEIPKPFQLEYCVGSHPIFSTGKWFVDLSIDRINDNNKFANCRDKWLLPIKANLSDLFIKEFDSRILKNGEISFLISSNKKFSEISNPNDDLIFRYIICGVPKFSFFDSRRDEIAPYQDCQLSDKGKYLQQVLGLFGGLSNFIDNMMSKRFWRNQVDNLATFTVTDRDSIIKKLKRRMGEISKLKDDQYWENLCDCTIKIAKYVKAPKNKIRFDDLKKHRHAELEKAIELYPNLQKQKEDIIDNCLKELDETFKFLLEINIFYRGHEWSCKHCSHSNWANVSSLDEKVICAVCKMYHQLPLDFHFEFRLNEFFATCVREHDTVSVGWALSNLRSSAKKSFIYTPPLTLYENLSGNGGSPDNELDVLCIVDGELILAEVKNSLDKVRPKDRDNLVKLAIKLKVDKVMIMAITGHTKRLETLVADLRKKLPNSIKVDGQISNWNDDPSSIDL